jgi:hypothetical protein
MEAFLQDVARRYAQFVERFGDHLPPERRALFELLRVSGAPQRRGWLVSASLIRVTVGWPGSW